MLVTALETTRQTVRSTQMGTLEVNHATIRATPTLLGEADIIRTLQLTPGVAGTEGISWFCMSGVEIHTQKCPRPRDSAEVLFSRTKPLIVTCLGLRFRTTIFPVLLYTNEDIAGIKKSVPRQFRPMQHFHSL